MISILQVEEGLYVLTEDGRNVLLRDCIQFGVSKAERKQLFLILLITARRLQKGISLDSLIEGELIKQLSRQGETLSGNIWEVRDIGGGARVIFKRDDLDSIIISAVHKGHGSLSQAINRGVNRWQRYLKNKK